MAGLIRQAIPKTRVSFGVPTTGLSWEVIVARALDISTAREGTLICRVHSVILGSGGSGATIKFIGRAEAPTPEDPGIDFVPPAGAVDLGSSNAVSVAASPFVPFMVLVPLVTPPANSGNIGAWLRSIVEGGWMLPYSQFDGYVSIDLSEKS